MMADEMVYKQEFNIRNVATQSVTLYPARAQVVRDISDISLKVYYALSHSAKKKLTVLAWRP